MNIVQLHDNNYSPIPWKSLTTIHSHIPNKHARKKDRERSDKICLLLCIYSKIIDFRGVWDDWNEYILVALPWISLQ
jgi:hypothetical protein